MKRGHCTNLPSRCEKAKSKALIPITGPRTSCPDCGKLVQPIVNSGNPKTYLYIGLIVLCGLAIAVFKWWHNASSLRTPVTVNEGALVKPISCDRNPLLILNGSNVLGSTLTPDLVEAWMRSGLVQRISRSQQQGVITIVGERNGAKCVVRIAGMDVSGGLASLQQGTADIVMSPRNLDDTEVSSLSQLGNMRSQAAEHVVAIDAVAVIVNQANPIAQLSRGELSDVIAGRVTDWGAFQGAPRRINVFATSDGDRSSDTAKELLGSINSQVQRPSSDAGVLAGVSRDADAIGIVSFPATHLVRTLAVGEHGATAFLPSTDTIATQMYPLTRLLYYYAAPKPLNLHTSEFLLFAQGKAGQAVVARAGYGGQNVQIVASPLARENASASYNNLINGAHQINIAFRFKTGRAELDNKALDDLSRLVAFLPAQRGDENHPLMLIGFADTQGHTVDNVKLSEQRAVSVASALRAMHVEPGVVRWFGEEQPIGNNATAAGRERNRRVEAWIKP
jgi:phosphate transport system substrate-binding protein